MMSRRPHKVEPEAVEPFFDADRSELYVKCGSVAFARFRDHILSDPTVAEEVETAQAEVYHITISLAEIPYPPSENPRWVMPACGFLMLAMFVVFIVGLVNIIRWMA